MRLASALVFISVAVSSLTALSQSVYQLQYNFHTAGDSITYHAFLVRFDDGSGLLRVRYIMPGTSEDVLIEADMEDNPIADQSGLPDTNLLVLRSINPRFIIGNDKHGF